MTITGNLLIPCRMQHTLPFDNLVFCILPPNTFWDSTLKKSALGLLFIASTAFALQFYGNESEIKWKTADSEHFIYHYPAEFTGHAERAAAAAEAVYDSVTSRYPNKLPRKVHLSLRNALYSNGYAVPSETSMNLWLTNWDFKTRSSHGWLNDVVTHEFSHLVSIEDGAKVNPALFGLQLSYMDYYNERSRTDLVALIPFNLQPLWLAEGTAQFESERMGFDAWDSHRDMLLRTAVLADSLVPLPYMHAFAESSLKSELGPYTQGFSLVRYIAETYGEDAIPKIWTALAKPYRATLDAAFKDVIGIGEDSLYNAWKEHLKTKYEALQDSLGEIKAGTKLTANSYYQDFPVVAGDYVYGVSNFGGAWFDGSIFKMPTNVDSLMKDSTEEEGIKISVENTIDITEHSKSGFKMKKSWVDKGVSVRDVKEQGPMLAYVSYQNRNRHGRAAFDIFVVDTAGNSKEVTHLADAVYPEINYEGTEVIFARRESGKTRFILSKAPITKSGKAEDFQDIWVPPEEYIYYNIYSPKLSPDGKRIVFSYFDDKTRGIAVVDYDGKNFQKLSEDSVDSRDPAWIDNKTIVYSSDRNGIYNLYKKSLDNSIKETPLTNVVGGAFTPTASNGIVFYTGYDADGFSLYKLELPQTKTDSTVYLQDVRWIISAKAPFVASRTSVFEDLFFTNAREGRVAKDSSTLEKLLGKNAGALLQPSLFPQVTLRDSTFKLEQTIPQLYGKRITNDREQPQILNDVSFAGSERNYKPIPVIPMIIPIVSFEERAPTFSVNKDGETLAKIGSSLILADLLKINTIQLGLLFEVTNGFDYISDGGINPDKHYDFFALWENRSTPVTFNVGYSYSNLTSEDTVHYEDPRSFCEDNLDDCYGVSNYAVAMQTIMGNAGYSVFKQGDTLNATIAYDWADFNLYEDNFEWTYHKRLMAGLMLGYYTGLGEGNNIGGSGSGAGIAYSYSNAELYRSGTFAETFVVSSSGKITPVYRDFKLHEIALNAFTTLGNPIHDGARFAFGASVTGILDWQSKKSDTLDTYYYHPLLLEGYPYLITTEDFNRSGTKTAIAQVHYIFPILKDFRHGLWIFETKDLYMDLFAQVGAAWDLKWINTDKFKTRDFWDRSVGLEIRLANNLFHSTPFNISLNIAKGLDRVGENKDGSGGHKMNPIDIPLLPKKVSPTRIHLTIGTAFNNMWQN